VEIAACNQFLELEKYCGNENCVGRQLKNIIEDPERGIQCMIQEWQLTIKLFDQVVSEIIADIELKDARARLKGDDGDETESDYVYKGIFSNY
jgi:hypothetical protein